MRASLWLPVSVTVMAAAGCNDLLSLDAGTPRGAGGASASSSVGATSHASSASGSGGRTSASNASSASSAASSGGGQSCLGLTATGPSLDQCGDKDFTCQSTSVYNALVAAVNAGLTTTDLTHRSDGSAPASGTPVPADEYKPLFSITTAPGPDPAVWSSIYPPGGISAYCNGSPCQSFALQIDFQTPVTAAAVVVAAATANVRFLNAQGKLVGQRDLNNGAKASIVAFVSPTRFQSIEIQFSSVGKISTLYSLPCP